MSVMATMNRSRPPCSTCGFYHRYGTTDPEHEFSPWGCINTLRGRLEGVIAVHQPKEIRFVDDDGAQHAPVEVCSTCQVQFPCPTLVAVRSR